MKTFSRSGCHARTAFGQLWGGKSRNRRTLVSAKGGGGTARAARWTELQNSELCLKMARLGLLHNTPQHTAPHHNKRSVPKQYTQRAQPGSRDATSNDFKTDRSLRVNALTECTDSCAHLSHWGGGDRVPAEATLHTHVSDPRKIGRTWAFRKMKYTVVDHL